MDYKALLEHCEAEIRAGHAERVAQRLGEVNSAQVTRSYRLPLANLCRRASLTSLGLRILAPVARPDRARPLDTPATGPELAEYAVLLMRNGSVPEALRLLEGLSAADVPEVTMYRGFCHQMRWDYTHASHELELYLRAPLNEYSAFVAKVNLASAWLSSGRLEEAKELLSQGIEEAHTKSYHRLLGNCHELRAQAHVFGGDWDRARADLADASRILGAEKSSDQLFILKWRAILQGLETHSTEPIVEFRQEALRRHHWESVRECDFFTLKIDFTEPLFDHLLFGTPYAAYRERVCRVLGRAFTAKEFNYGEADAPELNLQQGTFAGRSLLNPGKNVHRLLAALMRDFYKPTPLGGLFSELFPGEYFDVHSSLNRLHQLLWRSRSWLRQHQIPLILEEHANSYRLTFKGRVAIQLRAQPSPLDTHHVQWARLESLVPEKVCFRAEEVRLKLGVSATSFRRLVKWGIEQGVLERRGQGRATKFARLSTVEKAA